MDGDLLGSLRAAGISDEGVVQAVTIAAVFNHLTRVADATGVEADYESTLPRLRVDLEKEAPARPARDRARPSRVTGLSLALRPGTERANAAWRAYARAPSAALDARDRIVIGARVATLLGDTTAASSWSDASPGSAREVALADFAEKLTITPWRMTEADLLSLRRADLDDRGLLDVIGLVGFQNMDSRVLLALGDGPYEAPLTRAPSPDASPRRAP